jgi:hypothetical protein
MARSLKRGEGIFRGVIEYLIGVKYPFFEK